jgi:hypothetical protein
MTLRQLWVRLQVVLSDPQSLLNLALDRDRAEADETEQITDIDDALANVMRPPNGG